MSVLQYLRTESKAEYVNTANALYVETLHLLTHLSSRYSRLVAQPTARLAGEVQDYAEKANATYPSDETRKKVRKEFLLRAVASLSALDVRLTQCYILLRCDKKGIVNSRQEPRTDAEQTIDRISEQTGLLIEQEKTLLRKVMESDAKR